MTTSAMEPRRPPFALVVYMAIAIACVAVGALVFVVANRPHETRASSSEPQVSPAVSLLVVTPVPVATTAEAWPETTASANNAPSAVSSTSAPPISNGAPRKPIKSAGGNSQSTPGQVDPSLLGRP